MDKPRGREISFRVVLILKVVVDEKVSFIFSHALALMCFLYFFDL